MPRPKCPPIAADIITEIGDKIVLIERRNFPLGWAIPGGFVDFGETVEQAAVREAREETSLEVDLRALLGVYSRPDRDPRGQTITVVYVARASGTHLPQQVPTPSSRVRSRRQVAPSFTAVRMCLSETALQTQMIMGPIVNANANDCQ